MKKRYDSYKPSGIDWIGDIPSHWNIAPIKNSFRLFAGATPKTERSEYWDGDIVWITPADYKTDDHYINEGRKNITKEGLASCATEIVPRGSLIFSKRAPIGTVALADTPICTNQGCISCVPKSKTISNYFYYLCRIATSEFEILGSGATFLEISSTNFANFKMPLPPLAEQEAIAAWLDEKCEDIDAAIAKVDREIELIDELKQSEISRVVTRGLNPDAPLCPSGIDWIGDIPKHWIICKVKHLVKFNSGDTITSEQFIDNAEFPVYGANGYRGQFDKYNFENQRILIGRVGALCGNVHYTNEKIWCSEHALISSKAFGGLSFDYKWMCLLFESMNLNQYGGGSAQPVIASSVIENLSIILPPLAEQQAIADYLDKKCTEIDGLKAKLIKKRETLKELRQSIISEVVTGKRKVI